MLLNTKGDVIVQFKNVSSLIISVHASRRWKALLICSVGANGLNAPMVFD